MPKHFCRSEPKIGFIRSSGVNHCLFSGSWNNDQDWKGGKQSLKATHLEIFLLEVGPELLDDLGPGDLLALLGPDNLGEGRRDVQGHLQACQLLGRVVRHRRLDLVSEIRDIKASALESKNANPE